MMRWIAIALMGCGSVHSEPDAAVPADVAAAPDAPLDASIPPDMLVPPDAIDAPAPPGRWTLVQTRATTSSELNLAPVGSPHLIIVAVHSVGKTGIVVTDNGPCNAYTSIPDAHANCEDVSEVQIFYAVNSCSGASTISVTPASEAIGVAAWEVSGISTSQPLGNANALGDGMGNPIARGPSVTTTTEGEFVVSAVVSNSVVSGIVAGNPFTNDHNTDNTDDTDSLTRFGGWAHLTDPTARAGAYQAQWTRPADTVYCTSAAAFKVGS